MSEVAGALRDFSKGKAAQLDAAFQACYPELKRIAHARLRSSGLQGYLQTTALVHDGYLKLVAGAEHDFPDRVRFLAYASRALRSIVIDFVREEAALRRGGNLHFVTLDTAAGGGIGPEVDIEAVSRALDDLARLDEGLARLVEMRFFGGLKETEIAAALDISERTVRREWTKARAILLSLIAE